jgi:hypothetical protein
MYQQEVCLIVSERRIGTFANADLSPRLQYDCSRVRCYCTISVCRKRYNGRIGRAVV